MNTRAQPQPTDPRRSRLVARAAVVAASVAMLVAGCNGDDTSGFKVSPSPTAGDTAEGTATAFLQAIADGELSVAVQASTMEPDDFACSALISDQGHQRLVAKVESVDIDPSGDSATATVAPQAHSDRLASLDLVGGDGAWLVEWPSQYVFTAEFSELAVAELQLEGSSIGDDDCSVLAHEGSMNMAVFPGNYIATVVDPTGVVEYRLGTNVRVTGEPGEAWDLGKPVPEAQLTDLQLEFAEVRDAGVVRCDGRMCDDNLMGDGAQVLPGSLTRVWTDDGETWSCEVEYNGQVFTGTLGRSAAGDLRVDLNNPN